MRKLARRLLILVLFLALIAALLWFQGILFRDEHPPTQVPAPPAVGAADRTARVETRRVAGTEVYPGFVEAIDPAEIAPRVMATVLLVAAREGDPVAEGKVVVSLDDQDARARLAQAKAALDAAGAGAVQARLAFDRAQRLLDADALTTQEWEAARAARDAALAQEERARQAVGEAETALSWYRLTAPFAGHVLERNVEPGQLASPGRAVLTIYRPDRLRFGVAVPEERAAGLAVGAKLALAFDRLPSRTATLERILPNADPRTGTVVLHLALEGAGDLRPGVLGRLDLPVGEREVNLIPAAAVERIGQVERVQLVRDGRLVPVTVRTGKQHDGMVEVLSGLAAGEEVRLP